MALLQLNTIMEKLKKKRFFNWFIKLLSIPQKKSKLYGVISKATWKYMPYNFAQIILWKLQRQCCSLIWLQIFATYPFVMPLRISSVFFIDILSIISLYCVVFISIPLKTASIIALGMSSVISLKIPPESQIWSCISLVILLKLV